MYVCVCGRIYILYRCTCEHKPHKLTLTCTHTHADDYVEINDDSFVTKLAKTAPEPAQESQPVHDIPAAASVPEASAPAEFHEEVRVCVR